ncbi:hypothetical protein HKX48_005616 [Thoreauomyces humboldtii]|nr:hypothetical protein HKX48_005616 [Thoreauomyces humboldtii]
MASATANAEYVHILLPYLRPFQDETGYGMAMSAIGFAECISGLSTLFAHRAQHRKPVFLLSLASIVFATASCIAMMELLSSTLINFQAVWPPGDAIDLNNPLPRATQWRQWAVGCTTAVAFFFYQVVASWRVRALFGNLGGWMVLLHIVNILGGLLSLVNTVTTVSMLLYMGQVAFQDGPEARLSKVAVVILVINVVVAMTFNMLFTYHLVKKMGMKWNRGMIAKILTSQGAVRQAACMGLAVV